MRAPLRLLVREMLGFGGVGATAFVVQLGVLNLLVHHGIGPLTANAAAMVLSAAVAYAGSRWISFRHRRGARVGREAAAFVAVNAATFVVGEIVLATAYLGGAAHDRVVINVLTLVGIVIGTVLRFFAYRRFVFVAVLSPAEPVPPSARPAPRVDRAAPVLAER